MLVCFQFTACSLFINRRSMFIHLLLRYCIYNLLYIFPALLRTQTVKPRMLRIACNCNIIAIFCIIRFDGKVIPGAVRFHTVVIRKAIFHPG